MTQDIDLDALEHLSQDEYLAALDPATVRTLIGWARLGAAWEAAEAALPEGWRMAVGQGSEEWPGLWTASASSLRFFNGENDNELITGEADTPAGALQALAAELAEPLWGPEGPAPGQIVTIKGTTMQTRWTGTHWEPL